MEIFYDELLVEDGEVLYDMADLCQLSRVYERLCTANYLYENQQTYNIKLDDMEMAYKVADIIRDKVEDYCECESETINEWVNEVVDWVRKGK